VALSYVVPVTVCRTRKAKKTERKPEAEEEGEKREKGGW